MSAVGTDVNLAEQALANLVNQFARPLDFLRELVQNSIDAGSPRVAISVAYDADDGEGPGVLRIHVDDWGEGMDETIIDNQLTRLFSSTKENDLTKIGKFGIGFTSIFAIHPDAVLLRTGRHGEFWELLFHRDRSFDKVRVQEPVDGTRITLFKRMPRDEAERFSREARWILGYWCEHSNTPITFWDRTQAVEATVGDDEDPFAAFEDPEAVQAAGPETVNQPLELPADLSHRVVQDDIEVVIGYADPPRFGYYNGGLTLLSTANDEVLGRHADKLGHLGFKLKSNALEHTLTRDNVLQDQHWETAMAVALRAAGELRQRLLQHTASVAAEGGDLSRWHRYITAEVRVVGAGWLNGNAKIALFRDHRGNPVPLGAVKAQEAEVGAVLFDPGPGALRDALDAEGVLLLENEPATRELLLATAEASIFGGAARHIRAADEVFLLPELVDADTLNAQEEALLSATASLLEQAAGRRLSVKLGNFGGAERARKDVLAIDGPGEGGVFQRPGTPWFRMPAFLNWRTLLVNRHHPFFQAQLLAGVEDLGLAAFALASALLHIEGVEGEKTYQRLLEAAMARIDREEAESP